MNGSKAIANSNVSTNQRLALTRVNVNVPRVHTCIDEDAAELPAASIQPEPVNDSLRDILREAICRYRGPVPSTEDELKLAFFRLVDDGLQDARAMRYQDVDKVAAAEVLAECLFRLKDLIHTRLHVYALLICLGKIPDAEEVVARQLGVTKAAVSRAKIIVQEFYGLHCRVGRTQQARSKFTALALSRPAKPQRWHGKRFFSDL